MQYRYWSYIEAHPAHVPLTAESHSDALEILRWSYTGRSLVRITSHGRF